MGILNKFKRAMGLAPDGYDDEENFGEDATVTPLREQTNKTSHSDNTSETVEAETIEDAPVKVPVDRIFETVIAEFNKSLPSFLAQSVDPESQRRALYSALDNDVKNYLDELAAKSLEACNRRWSHERTSLNAQLANLKTQNKSLEETLADKTKQVLSADRQRRAINERIRDLEAKIATLEAEKEQYDLENRSLLNKMRAHGVIEGGASDTYANPDITLENEQLKKHLAEALETVNALKKETAGLHQDNSQLQESIAALKMKSDMSDTMFTDLNERAATATREVTERDTLIAEANAQLEEARRENAELKNELEEANSNLDIAAEVLGQVERLKEMQENKTKVINELTLEIKKRDDRINALEAQEKSLRGTIEANIKDHALNIQELNNRIEALQNDPASYEKPSKRRKTTPRISAIDDDIDNTDWLVSTPPEGSSIKTSGVSDEEFGYQAPQRKTPPENSSQMSLW